MNNEEKGQLLQFEKKKHKIMTTFHLSANKITTVRFDV